MDSFLRWLLNFSRGRLTIQSLFPLIVWGVVAGCVTPEPAVVGKRSCCVSLPAMNGALTTNQSVLEGGSVWTSAEGERATLNSLHGKPTVVAFFFTSCELICPVTVERLKWIERSLSPTERAHVRFVLVSIDPERDTPERLLAYRQCHQLRSERWTLLRGAPEETARLAARLGVAYRHDAMGGMRHSNQITVLDAQGRLFEQQIGIQEGSDKITAALRKLMPTENLVVKEK